MTSITNQQEAERLLSEIASLDFSAEMSPADMVLRVFAKLWKDYKYPFSHFSTSSDGTYTNMSLLIRDDPASPYHLAITRSLHHCTCHLRSYIWIQDFIEPDCDMSHSVSMFGKENNTIGWSMDLSGFKLPEQYDKMKWNLDLAMKLLSMFRASEKES